jgi:hypothetical protein
MCLVGRNFGQNGLYAAEFRWIFWFLCTFPHKLLNNGMLSYVLNYFRVSFTNKIEHSSEGKRSSRLEVVEVC